MDVIKGILIIILVVLSDISFYYWGRRDGFDRCQQLTLEYFLEKIKEMRKDNGMDS